MAKRNQLLTTPKALASGIVQTSVEVDYVYIHDNEIVVYTKQGNCVNIPVIPAIQAVITKIEDAVFAILNT